MDSEFHADGCMEPKNGPRALTGFSLVQDIISTLLVNIQYEIIHCNVKNGLMMRLRVAVKYISKDIQLRQLRVLLIILTFTTSNC